MVNNPQRDEKALDYDNLFELFSSLKSIQTPAELHGQLTGYLCSGKRFQPDTWLQVAQKMMDIDALTDEAKVTLINLYDHVITKLEDQSFGFQPLLPDEAESLTAQARAIGSWSQSFLAGFGLGGAIQSSLSEEIIGILRDFAQIAQLETELEDSDSNESDLTEIIEYVRMAALLVYTEFNKTSDQKQTQSNPPKKKH
ncbi:UPF0149 family protein [Zooshikella sp. RANM57]|uniref:UPF0149 family protein n=1 Tax=Zooshikella sp. RANM57 TaxID=3425863 RepID=UPI003D6E7673